MTGRRLRDRTVGMRGERPDARVILEPRIADALTGTSRSVTAKAQECGSADYFEYFVKAGARAAEPEQKLVVGGRRAERLPCLPAIEKELERPIPTPAQRRARSILPEAYPTAAVGASIGMWYGMAATRAGHRRIPGYARSSASGGTRSVPSAK
jgi:hypothetical protein